MQYPPDPEPLPAESPTVPLLPLPGVFLFPRQLVHLRMAEAAQRELVEDSLDGPGRLVIGTVPEAEGGSTEGKHVLPIAGLGEIARHARTAEGGFDLWVLGLERVCIEEVASERAYRKVRISLLEETSAEPSDASRLRPQLERAIQQRIEEARELPEDLPIEILVDLLCQGLSVPEVELWRLFGEPDVARRAELALAAHESHPGSP